MKRKFSNTETEKCSYCSNRSWWKVLWERLKIRRGDAITNLTTWQRFQRLILKIRVHQNHQKIHCILTPFKFRRRKYHFSRHKETWKMRAVYLSFSRIMIMPPLGLLFSKWAKNRNNWCKAGSRSTTHSKKFIKKVPRRLIIINKCVGIIKVGLYSHRPSKSMSSRREGQ